MAEQLDVVTRTYDLAVWLLPQVAKFPRSYRFTLGDRLVGLVEAQYRAKRLPVLQEMDLKPGRLRLLVRLARALKRPGPSTVPANC